MLASLVFACGGLDFSATQHFETFAGRMEVTKAEIEAALKKRHIQVNKTYTLRGMHTKVSMSRLYKQSLLTLTTYPVYN